MGLAVGGTVAPAAASSRLLRALRLRGEPNSHSTSAQGASPKKKKVRTPATRFFSISAIISVTYSHAIVTIYKLLAPVGLRTEARASL